MRWSRGAWTGPVRAGRSARSRGPSSTRPITLARRWRRRAARAQHTHKRAGRGAGEPTRRYAATTARHPRADRRWGLTLAGTIPDQLQMGVSAVQSLGYCATEAGSEVSRLTQAGRCARSMLPPTPTGRATATAADHCFRNAPTGPGSKSGSPIPGPHLAALCSLCYAADAASIQGTVTDSSDAAIQAQPFL